MQASRLFIRVTYVFKFLLHNRRTQKATLVSRHPIDHRTPGILSDSMTARYHPSLPDWFGWLVWKSLASRRNKLLSQATPATQAVQSVRLSVPASLIFAHLPRSECWGLRLRHGHLIEPSATSLVDAYERKNKNKTAGPICAHLGNFQSFNDVSTACLNVVFQLCRNFMEPHRRLKRHQMKLQARSPHSTCWSWASSRVQMSSLIWSTGN